MRIGLTGTNSAGKGTAAEYISGKYNMPVYSLSDEIRYEADRRGLERSRDNLRQIGNDLREKHGHGALAEMLLPRLEGKAMVDSIRHPAEVAVLRRLDDFYLLSIDAPVELRYERALNRGRLESATTLEEFRYKEDLEKSGHGSGQQIHNTMAASDYKVWNDGQLGELYKKIDNILINCK